MKPSDTPGRVWKITGPGGMSDRTDKERRLEQERVRELRRALLGR